MTVDSMTGKMPVIGFVVALAFISCDSSSEERTGDYVFKAPENFPAATYTFENNPVTPEGFELGRMLFYDPILSIDSTISCSTCHKQQTAFADPTHRINHGINNRFGKRNSPGLANMAFMQFYFYDGGVNHLDFVPINAITNEVEMGNTMEDVINRLAHNPVYATQFKSAFNKDVIDSQQLLHALAQFTVMLVSGNAKFDRVMRGEASFTDDERQGYALFSENCATCHTPPLFTDLYFHNNGLDSDFTKDIGRELITESHADRGKFKVPSLRNIELTAPFMHDGRFSTLDEVLQHYSAFVKESPTLDPLLRINGSIGIPLSETDKKNILAFLGTLTDREFTTDKRFTDPFKK